MFRCFKNACLFFLVSGLLSLSCHKESSSPTCQIEMGINTEAISRGEVVNIKVSAFDPDGKIKHVILYIDNTAVCTSVNVPFIYAWNTINASPGNHTISACATDIENNTTEILIHCTVLENPALYCPPAPAFNAHHLSFLVNSPVLFFDQSTNNPTSRTWDFGDGTTGTGLNPVHTYLKAGTYSIKLTVSNTYGTDSLTKCNYITISSKADTVVSDFDGHVYGTVKIGEQLWLKENIKSTHYLNGTPIAEGSNAGNLDYDTLSKFHFSYENQESNISAYGRLYTWSAVMGGALSSNSIPSGVQGICPRGWHVPSDAEWMELELFLGMDPEEVLDNKIRGDKEGGMLKEKGTTHWMSPNGDASDLYGFAAVPGGERFWSGVFRDKTRRGCYWTSTKVQHNAAWQRLFYHSHGKISRSDFSRISVGASVRCIKDQ
jgi:uncharacterized protein (TIGR02145 family)